MRKQTVLFIISFLFISLLINTSVIAEDVAVKINDSVLTVDQLEKGVNNRLSDMSRQEAEMKTVNAYIDEQVKLQLIEKKDLDLTEEVIYERIRSLETRITRNMRNVLKMGEYYPIGHFSGKEPSMEEIAERLASFDNVDPTADQLIRVAEVMAIDKVVNDFYSDKAEKKLEEGVFDEEIKKDFKSAMSQIEEQIEEFTEEQKEANAEQIKKVREMTMEDFKEENWSDYRSKKSEDLKDEALKNLKEELDIRIKIDNPHL